jgi:gluconokinase
MLFLWLDWSLIPVRITGTLMVKRHKKRTAAKSRPRRSPSRGLRQTRPSERQTASSVDKPSVLVVMGVSGSGKSTIAAMLAHRLNWIFEEGDWFHPPSNIEKMHRGEPLTDEDRWPWLEGIAAWIDATRHAGNHGTVACSALKRAYRDILIGERPDVRIVYLKGGRDLIARRLAARNGHFMPPALLDSQFATLEEPQPDEHPIVVSIAAHPREVVEQIVRKLGKGAVVSVPGSAVGRVIAATRSHAN